MTNAWIGKGATPRVAALVAALLGVHLGCSLDSLTGLSDGTKRDAQSADARRDRDLAGSAEVTSTADISLPSTGGTGGAPLAGTTGVSDAQSPGAGGTAGLGGDASGLVATGGWTESAGGAGLTDSGGTTQGGGSVGSGGWPGSGGGQGSGGDSAIDSGELSEAGGSADQAADGSGDGGSLIPDAPADTSSSPDTETADTPPVQRSLLFVVAATPLVTSDALLRARLQFRGFQVTVVRDVDLATATKVVDLVIISRGTFALAVNSKFRNTPTPVLVCEPSLYVDMGMVDKTLGSWGTLSATSLVMNPWATALTAGLSGRVAMLSAHAEDLSYGVPSAWAILVATFLEKPTLWSIFAYDTGATMFGLNAPARRGGFFFSTTAPNGLTNDGWQLFDTMVDWLME